MPILSPRIVRVEYFAEDLFNDPLMLQVEETERLETRQEFEILILQSETTVGTENSANQMLKTLFNNYVNIHFSK